MPRKTKAKFTMKGHALPGIKQDPAMANKTNDYRPGSSAFTMKQESPAKLIGGLKKFAGSKIGRIGLGIATGGMSEVARGVLGGGKKKEDADAGKELLKQEAKEEMANSPASMKLRTGRKKRIGGKLNARTTPFDQKIDMNKVYAYMDKNMSSGFEGFTAKQIAGMSERERTGNFDGYEKGSFDKMIKRAKNALSKKKTKRLSYNTLNKNKNKDFNFSKLRRKPTMLDTDFSGRFPNPG
tara:strand:- start:3 stop:719 length:717 start_codon:yes stop_codon:yes gene_type:complete